eukprot:1185352-Prorocentrum_minimum.AAC.2
MGPPSPEQVKLIHKAFQNRWGVPNVALAVDGTHVPYAPKEQEYREDFHNYKGWYSLSCVAFVNSFYMFQGVEVGWAGRHSDVTITRAATYYKGIYPERYLGVNGVALGDGAFSSSSPYILPPYATPSTEKQQWFSFCHSSTRFYVEQTFGMWKNRFRFLVRANNLDHKNASRAILATMILHNMCMVHQEKRRYPAAAEMKENIDVNHNKGSLDQRSIQDYMVAYPQKLCPECARKQMFSCPHNRKRTKVAPADNILDLRDKLADALWLEKEKYTEDLLHVFGKGNVQ